MTDQPLPNSTRPSDGTRSSNVYVEPEITKNMGFSIKSPYTIFVILCAIMIAVFLNYASYMLTVSVLRRRNARVDLILLLVLSVVFLACVLGADGRIFGYKQVTTQNGYRIRVVYEPLGALNIVLYLACVIPGAAFGLIAIKEHIEPLERRLREIEARGSRRLSNTLEKMKEGGRIDMNELSKRPVKYKQRVKGEKELW